MVCVCQYVCVALYAVLECALTLHNDHPLGLPMALQQLGQELTQSGKLVCLCMCFSSL
jgi:hypothetical protein